MIASALPHSLLAAGLTHLGYRWAATRHGKLVLLPERDDLTDLQRCLLATAAAHPKCHVGECGACGGQMMRATGGKRRCAITPNCPGTMTRAKVSEVELAWAVAALETGSAPAEAGALSCGRLGDSL